MEHMENDTNTTNTIDAINSTNTEETFVQSNTSPKKKIHIRQQMVIFLSVTICIVLVALLVGLSMQKYAASKTIGELEDHIRAQANYLTEALREEEILDDNSRLSSGVDAMARALNGRIMLVDTQYRIILDTYHSNDQKYLIHNDVHESMMNSSDLIRRENNYIQYIFLIHDEDDQVKAAGIITVNTGMVTGIADSLKNQSKMLVTIFVLLGLLVGFIVSLISIWDIRRLKKQLTNMKDGLLGQVTLDKVFYEVEELTDDINGIFTKAQLLEESRQEFVSNVSHELKTPITSMKVLSESLMMQENVPVETYREFMNDIVQEIDREAQIINDLLTLVRTDKGPDSLNFENVDMNALMEVILKRLKPLAEKRKIEVIYESFREVTADIDKVKFTLAISNLIENGIKYNVDGGWIRVSLNADHKNLYIKVADSGVGIPDDCVEHIFERFYRVDKARSRDTGGTGLGLAISRNIIVLHKGTINVYSEPGKGTTFTVRVPMNYVK